jgi:hypothetical protein
LIVKFIEDVEPSGSVYPQRFYLEEIRELTEAPSYKGWFIKIIIALLAHFDLELHQMDMRNNFPECGSQVRG